MSARRAPTPSRRSCGCDSRGDPARTARYAPACRTSFAQRCSRCRRDGRGRGRSRRRLPRCTAPPGASAAAPPPATGSSRNRRCRSGRPCRSTISACPPTRCTPRSPAPRAATSARRGRASGRSRASRRARTRSRPAPISPDRTLPSSGTCWSSPPPRRDAGPPCGSTRSCSRPRNAATCRTGRSSGGPDTCPSRSDGTRRRAARARRPW